MSLTAEDLQAIRAIIKEETEPIKADIEVMKEDIEVIKEKTEIIRGATEEIIEWFSTYQRGDKEKPFPARESDIQLKIKLDEEALKSS